MAELVLGCLLALLLVTMMLQPSGALSVEELEAVTTFSARQPEWCGRILTVAPQDFNNTVIFLVLTGSTAPGGQRVSGQASSGQASSQASSNQASSSHASSSQASSS